MIVCTPVSKGVATSYGDFSRKSFETMTVDEMDIQDYEGRRQPGIRSNISDFQREFKREKKRARVRSLMMENVDYAPKMGREK